MFRVLFYLVTFADGTTAIKGVRWNLETGKPMDKPIPERYPNAIKIVALDGCWELKFRDIWYPLGNDQLFN